MGVAVTLPSPWLAGPLGRWSNLSSLQMNKWFFFCKHLLVDIRCKINSVPWVVELSQASKILLGLSSMPLLLLSLRLTTSNAEVRLRFTLIPHMQSVFSNGCLNTHMQNLGILDTWPIKTLFNTLFNAGYPTSSGY